MHSLDRHDSVHVVEVGLEPLPVASCAWHAVVQVVVEALAWKLRVRLQGPSHVAIVLHHDLMVLSAVLVPLMLRVEHQLGVPRSVGGVLGRDVGNLAAAQGVQQHQEPIGVQSGHTLEGPLGDTVDERIAHGVLVDDVAAVFAGQEVSLGAVALVAIHERPVVILDDSSGHACFVEQAAEPSVAVAVAILRLPSRSRDVPHGLLEPGLLRIVAINAHVGKPDVQAPPELDVGEDSTLRLHHLWQVPKPGLDQPLGVLGVKKIAINGPQLPRSIIGLHCEVCDDPREAAATSPR
mmetsp:Transcript_8858/g.24537  ORF Transcript_8858/g.24537 Transcript_8858/m.24537 type:complete len:293 (-) Transcript_8858:748-1626(-)